VHDFFNLLAVFIFLPLETAFDILEKAGLALASLLVSDTSLSMSGFNFMKAIINPPVSVLENDLLSFLPDMAQGITMIVLAIAMIFVSITLIGKLLRVLMVGKAKDIFHKAVGRGPLVGITSGALMTVLVQSSSTTTSLIVPLAGTNVFSLRQVFSFTLGANIGTCITGLLAATAVTGVNAVFAMQIAIIHLLFNLLSVILIYSIPFLREIPLKAAVKLADLAQQNKMYVLGYILAVFFLIPLVAIALTKLFG
jgi:sodium-dependent phosphate cotransporter